MSHQFRAILWILVLSVIVMTAQLCTPVGDCVVDLSGQKSITCNPGSTCTITCDVNSECIQSNIICSVGATCDVSCGGSGSCQYTTFYALEANKLTITTGENSAAYGANITCPNNGRAGNIACILDSTSSKTQQYGDAEIRAIEGFNDVSITCNANNNCANGLIILCGMNYEHTCNVYDTPPTFTQCDGDTYCETFLIPITSIPTTNQPTASPITTQPTTNQPTTNISTTNRPTTNIPTTNLPTTNGPTTNVPSTNEPITDVPTTNEPTPTSEPLIIFNETLIILVSSNTTNISDILDIVNDAINTYLVDLFVDYNYQLVVEEISNENDILIINIIVTSLETEDIDKDYLIVQTGNDLTNKYGDDVKIQTQFTSTIIIETTESALNRTFNSNYMPYIYIAMSIISIIMIMIVFVYFYKRKKQQNVTKSVIKKLELATNSTHTGTRTATNSTHTGTETTLNDKEIITSASNSPNINMNMFDKSGFIDDLMITPNGINNSEQKTNIMMVHDDRNSDSDLYSNKSDDVINSMMTPKGNSMITPDGNANVMTPNGNDIIERNEGQIANIMSAREITAGNETETQGGAV